MKRLSLWLAAVVAIVGLTVMLTRDWLIHTEAGARWIMSRVTVSLEGQLEYGAVQGSFDEGVTLAALRFARPSLVVTADSLQVTASLPLLPLGLDIRSMRIEDLVIRQDDGPASESPGGDFSVENLLSSLTLPLPVEIREAQINGLEWHGPGAGQGQRLESLSLAARWKQSIELERLEARASWLQSSAQGLLELSPPFGHRLAASGKLSGASFNGGAPLGFDLSVEGDRSVSRVELGTSGPLTEITCRVDDPLGDARVALDGRSPMFEWLDETGEPVVRLGDVSVSIEGTADDYRVGVGARVDWADMEGVEAELNGQGNLEGIRINTLRARSEQLQAGASGRIDWAGRSALELDVQLERLDAGRWIDGWPQTHFLHGSASLSLVDAVFELREFKLQAAGTAAALEGRGLIDPQTGMVEGELNWTGVRWPLDGEEYLLASNSAALRVTGAPDRWQVDGRLDLATLDYPGGSFEVQGNGDRQTAEIGVLEGQVLGGRLSGRNSLDWSGPFKWDAELEVEQINLAAFSKDWPVLLDARLGLSLDRGQDTFELRFERLSGVFRGQALDGGGAVTLRGSGLGFRDFRLVSGASGITLDGSLESGSGLGFSMDVKRPGWAADYLGGEVAGRGRIALAGPEPVLDVELQARDLQWGDTRVDSISIGPGGQPRRGGLDLELRAQGIETPDSVIDEVSASLVGELADQALHLTAIDADYRLETTLEGSVSGWGDWQNLAWSGKLASLGLSEGELVLLELEQAAQLDISASAVRMGQACFATAPAGGLCVDSNWRQDGYLQVNGALSGVGLGVTEFFLAHQLDFTQTLDGDFQWRRKPGELPSGQASIRVSAGEFGDRNDQFDRVETAQGYFGFELINGELRAGKLDIPFPGIGQIDVDYAVSGMALDGSGQLDATVNVSLNDVSVLEELLPSLEQVSGRLESRLEVGGRTADPVLDGFVSLKDAACDIPYLGTRLQDIGLEGVFRSDDKATVKGQFISGEGRGSVVMDVDYRDWLKPTLEMVLSGSSLRLLNTPSLRLDADTDFRLGWRAGEWLVSGGVDVQQARFAPVASIVSQVTESQDLQVVAGTMPYGDTETESEPAKISGKLNISLGDKVEIDTEQARLKLTGGVELAWNGDLVPRANGTIYSNGTLSVFGPLLHVKDGQVRFINTPVSNPSLDIRANRDVFGNTQIRSAGVSISGTARRPVIEAYTIPYTNKDRAWALLITGSDVDYGQGVGAFEVGAYIAPKLYLSYGVSLFDDDYVISARYDLKRGFGVKATSSQRQSGVDVSYTVDR